MLALEGRVLLLVTMILLVVKIFAFVNSLMFSAESYVAAGKLTKPVWSLILCQAMFRPRTSMPPARWRAGSGPGRSRSITRST